MCDHTVMAPDLSGMDTIAQGYHEAPCICVQCGEPRGTFRILAERAMDPNTGSAGGAIDIGIVAYKGSPHAQAMAKWLERARQVLKPSGIPPSAREETKL